jgi:hypothetical protein
MKNFLTQIFAPKGNDSKTPADSSKVPADTLQEDLLEQDPIDNLQMNAVSAGPVHPPPKA